MNVDELCVLLGGTLIGRVTRDRRHRFSFVYEQSWRSSAHALPLSISMPLASSEHKHEPIEAFMWGLLPDNEQVLDRWAKRFQVSARNPFALISCVGEDCAGSVQFVRLERLGQLTGSGPVEVDWLDESDVATRLRTLREDHSSWRMARDTGQFSLAGAQPKTALLFDGGRWGVPSGRTPTTHILKPPTDDLDGHAENEHLCLALSRELGLPTAHSEVHQFENEKAIVVERYDRVRTARLAAAAKAATRAAVRTAPDASMATVNAAEATARAAELSTLAKTRPILRLHQEDLCQALGILPTSKYQNEGGPAPETIVQLVRTYSSRPEQDVATFVDALIFNWLIAGTDGHAKNYSLLLESGGQVRLAPLYDLGSALPYPDMDQRRLKLAMKLGDTYRIRDIAPRHFRQLAALLSLDAKAVLVRAEEMAGLVREGVVVVCERAKAAGLTHPMVDRFADAVVRHATHCQGVLAKG